MTHDVQWFFSTGIHDASWVQAIASVVLVVLTFITMVVLFRYAWDTRTLARMGVEQIDIVKRDRSIEQMRNFHVAYDRFLQLQNDLTSLMTSIVSGLFQTKRPEHIYPDDWPDITSTLYQRIPNTLDAAMKLGIELRKLDSTIDKYFEARTEQERQLRYPDVVKAVQGANELAKALLTGLPKAAPQN